MVLLRDQEETIIDLCNEATLNISVLLLLLVSNLI